MIKDYEKAIVDCSNAFEKFLNINFNIEFVGNGRISKERFKQLLEETTDYCQKMEAYCNEGEAYDKANAFISYKKALGSAMLLMGENKNLQGNTFYNGKILENIKNQVADCGQEIFSSACKLNEIKSENVINDLTDKILMIEREYNAGKLSNEKAYKHVLKIKNAFQEINVKTGNQEHDDNLEFLSYAIEESEKLYQTDAKIEVEDKCSSSEFLDDKTDEKIQDLTSDVENLTQNLNQFTDEISDKTIETNIDLDNIYGFISAINNSINESRILSADEINQYATQLNKQIDLLREQQMTNLFKSQEIRTFADIVYSSAAKLEEKSKTLTQNIVSCENAKRVGKISTQLETLEENTSESNLEILGRLNILLVKQSNACLVTNPELQTQINANFEKGKAINQFLISTL